jgi:putative endonuclease
VKLHASVVGRWFAYLVETDQGRLYAGVTTDVERRFAQHASGKGARFFRTQKPLRIHIVGSGLERSDALSLEARIKQMKPAEKRRLIHD